MKRNKIITTLLVVCMSLVLAFGLTGCKNDKCKAHTYDNACDATCNVCEETREVGDHQWAEADCVNPKTCEVCGVTEGVALGHTAEEDDGNCTSPILCEKCHDVLVSAKDVHIARADDGDCTTEITCTDCDVVLLPAKTHDFEGAEWQSDADGHWHVCKNDGCNVTDEKIYHTSDGPATVDRPEKCSFCEYTITPQLPQNTSEQALAMFQRYFCDSNGLMSIHPTDEYYHIWAYAPFGENACEVFSNITGLDVEAKESYDYRYISNDESVEIRITGTLAPDDNGVYATLYVTIPGYEDIDQIKLVTEDYINSLYQ